MKKEYVVLIALLLFGSLLFGCSNNDTVDETSFSFINQDELLHISDVPGLDIPWEHSAGVIDYNEKEYMLLLPNCEISATVEGIPEAVVYSVQLHPWVNTSSDGAGFELVISNAETGEVYKSEQIDITDTEKVSKQTIPIDVKSEGKYTILLRGNAGQTSDETCDWLMFHNLEIAGKVSVIAPEKLAEPQVPTEEYWVSANYFCGGWPKNMWDCELTDINADFARMRSDGFNSVIILIPWRQFQPTLEPVSYNPTAFEKLEAIMQAADQNDLKVVLRIGYYHDYYQNQDTTELVERFSGVFQPGKYRDAFMDYAAEVYSAASSHQSYAGAFICWEDFWGVVNLLKHSDSEKFHLTCAKKLGYQEYLAENYSLQEWNRLYGSAYSSYEEAVIPYVSEPAFRTFYDFIDQKLNQLLYDTQTVIPNLSMEIRLDADLVMEEDGTQTYYSHDATYLCEGSDFVSTVYGIPMGCLNQGERLTAEEGLEKTAYILGNLNSKINNKKLYVDQFLFYDDTVEFSYNARLKVEEVRPYLHQVHKILREKTCGIGIWTYQNYLFDNIYNGQFANGLDGWDTIGTVSLSTDATNCAKLGANASIMQTIPLNRCTILDGEKITLTFDVCDDATGTIIAAVGDQKKAVAVNGCGKYSAEFVFIAGGETMDVVLSTDTDITVDNAILYDYEQNGLLYDVDSNELDNIADLRVLIQNIMNYPGDAA